MLYSPETWKMIGPSRMVRCRWVTRMSASVHVKLAPIVMISHGLFGVYVWPLVT